MELTGKRVLVLEDEFLIGMELERIANDCGAKSVHVVSTVAELLFWIDSQQPCDIAILEVQARGASSFEAARLLLQRGIPLVFATAYDQQRGGIPGFANVPVVLKPYGKSHILQAVTAAAFKVSHSTAVAKDDDTSGEFV
ncbi:response regulator [Phyllobacterium myrsinacearum]|uniref:CheY-like chemotaxis protein n=1 Tax=Phyllobacterium myrsinacearum TaxID=28101 RepID=A0A839EN43_9HYPH|nr:response regulator [Phyllobacterium myrsinacearum]MBA8878070.1 CheY-like chemotaxis protein [Phyllobacterium myrsinacearum]